MSQSDIRWDLPRFSLTVDMVRNGTTVSDNYLGEVPMEVQDQAAALLGNGLARVTVSADMADKNFGSGAGAMVAVSLSCNQDITTINNAITLAGQIARYYAKEHRGIAAQELAASLPPKEGQNYSG